MEQDPMFAFRTMVDIGARTQSPAINDPATEVLAIDQIHRLLHAGFKDIDTGCIHDRNAKLRLIFPTPAWNDIVDLALTELRRFGAARIQVGRRMKAMLERLIDNLRKREPARNVVDAEDRRRANWATFRNLAARRRRTDEIDRPANR